MHPDSNMNVCGPYPHTAFVIATCQGRPHRPCTRQSLSRLNLNRRQEVCVKNGSNSVFLHVGRENRRSHDNNIVSLSRLRGGGNARTHRDATSLHLTSEHPAVVNSGKELKQVENKNNGNRGSRERSAILSELVAGMDVDDHSSTRKLSIQRVEQLRIALAKKDKAAISNALEKVGRHQIWQTLTNRAPTSR